MPPLLLVGKYDPVHVGSHLAEGAAALGLPMELVASDEAFRGNRWIHAVNWRLRGRRPLRLGGFSELVVGKCRERRPLAILTTGLAPVAESALDAIGRMGIIRMNYLTDDPWNPAHHARWFMYALCQYDYRALHAAGKSR